MAINLAKGQGIDLRRDVYDLNAITVGLGWKMRELPSGQSADADADFDLDAIAFLMDEHDKVRNLGDSKLVGGDVVFFNSRRHPSGTVTHSGDSVTGGTGTDDDEQIVVRLNSVPSEYFRILFAVTIYQGIKRGQHFGQLESAYIRALDGSGKEMARYSLDSDTTCDGQRAVVFGDVCRRGNGWNFRALGEAYPYDSFVHLPKNHLPY